MVLIISAEASLNINGQSAKNFETDDNVFK